MRLDVEHRSVVREDGTRIAYVVKGSGPLVLMVHGFPESWYSFRSQIDAVAAAGYTAAAIELRGYGQSDKPPEVSAYTSRENAADIVAVIDAIDPSSAVLVGHDWGAVVAQATTLIHPDKIRGLVTLSVSVLEALPANPVELMDSIYPESLFYQRYFHDTETASKEIEADLPKFLKMFFYWLSGDHPQTDSILVRPAAATDLLSGLEEPPGLPNWLSQEDFDFYVNSFVHGGIIGPLNCYPAFIEDYGDLEEYRHDRVSVPTMFIGGDLDESRYLWGFDQYEDPLSRCDDPRGVHVIPGKGHWIQQEDPTVVNQLLLAFLTEIH